MEPTVTRDQPEPHGKPTTLPVITEYIGVRPGYCGGEPHILGHRIKVRHVAVWHEQMGVREEPMSRLDLTSWQRRRLRRQLAETRDARLFQRTLAVLEFDHGRSAADIAHMLGVSRQSLYHWIEAYAQDHDPASLEDEGGRGRHPLLDEDRECLLEAVLAVPPRELGYPQKLFGAGLQRYLESSALSMKSALLGAQAAGSSPENEECCTGWRPSIIEIAGEPN